MIEASIIIAAAILGSKRTKQQAGGASSKNNSQGESDDFYRNVNSAAVGVIPSKVSPVNDRFIVPVANPGTAQSRINISAVTDDNGNARGWNYAIKRHGMNAQTGSNKSKFTLSDVDVKKLLQDANTVGSPVYNVKQSAGQVESNKFIRQINAGKIIGVDNQGNKTSIFTVITNREGNLINTFPGTI